MFTVEKPEEVNQITALYIDSIRQGQAEALSKHGELIKSIKEKGFTRGHYYKGIK
jgi:putative protease